jgi:hypothetical protein
MNIRQRLLKMDVASLTQYLAGAQQRTTDKNRMVSSAAKQSVAMIQAELAKRASNAI